MNWNVSVVECVFVRVCIVGWAQKRLQRLSEKSEDGLENKVILQQ